MYMIKTYIIKIQSRKLTHDHSFLSNDPEKQSQKLSQFRLKFLTLNRDRDRL